MTMVTRGTRRGEEERIKGRERGEEGERRRRAYQLNTLSLVA